MRPLAGFPCVILLSTLTGVLATSFVDSRAQDSGRDPLRKDTIVAQTSPLQHGHQQELDFWRRKEKEFSAEAAATPSVTRKEVLAMLVDEARKRESELQLALDALTKRAAAAPRSGPQLPPRPAPPAPPIRPPTSPSHVVGPPNPGPGGGPNPGSGFSIIGCQKDAIGVLETVGSVAEAMQRLAAAAGCYAPPLRASAAEIRPLASQKSERANKEPNPDFKSMWQREATAQTQIADTLDKLSGQLGQNLLSPNMNIAPPTASRTQDTAQSLCPALMKSTGKADSNDPYLVCDCARQYLTGRVTPLYEDVVSRVGRYVSVTSTPATSSLYGSSLNLLIDVAGRPPTTATRVISACHELLFLEERSRANSEYVHGSDPGFNPVSLETFRNSVYGQLGLELRDLWQAHIDEIFLGIFELTNIQSNREYVAWARLKVEIALNPNGDFRPYCSEADNTAQDSVNWLGREMPGVLAAMEVTRRQLERDLRFWQDFAARDGWPRQHSYVPFGEMADRLWKSAHLHGWTGPEADSVVVRVWTQRPTGGGGCDDWKFQPPGSAVLVTGTVNNADLSLPLFKDIPVTTTTFFSGADVSQLL